MLLRRITEHVKAQNWTAVALDFVIVVVGVFIGIQVSNWNEQGAQIRLGKDYESRLTADLHRDLTIYQNQHGYFSNVLESVVTADRLLNAGENSRESDAKALVVAAYRASEIMNESANRATWEQVVSSGHLGLLPERVLENGLADYYRYDESAINANRFLQESPYRLLVRSIIPLPVQLEIRAGCSDVTDEINIISGFVEACQLDVDDDTLEDVAATLRSSASLKAEIRHQYSIVANIQNNAAGNILLVQRVLAALDAEVDK